VRERLEQHRRDPSCTGCHSRIDPLGFALEVFDPIGRWRDSYRDDAAIESSGTLRDGTDISGRAGLVRYLERERPRVRRTLCVKLLGYALGRGELASDGALIDRMLAELDRDPRISRAILAIVTSRQFRFHRGDPEPETASIEEGAR